MMVSFETGLFIPKGYDPIQKLYKNEVHEIIKARSNADNCDVVLKITRPKIDNIKLISKLTHEYDIIKDLNFPSIIHVHRILSDGKSVCLVEEYCSGESLRSRIFNKGIVIKDFFEISINIAEALNYLYLHGIIHKDLNVNNILVYPDNKVKIIDFGISSSNQAEDHDYLRPDMIEGSLVYISPEQTGRTGYSVSHCSDLYSLGIIMYEMLSGKPPFDSTDPMEVIHFHLSRKPASLLKLFPDMPVGLISIISILLEKNPDDRYQSAAGLLFDLKVIFDAVQNEKDTSVLVLKTQDRSGKFKKIQKLYGREKEISKLHQCLETIKYKKTMLVLVAGYSGVGKSVFVKQLQKIVVEDKGLFLSGKFDQFKKNIPYFAFIEAFDDIVKSILSESDDKIAEWKENIIEVLGDNASLITEVIPSLELIIGKFPPTIKLQPAEQEYRFRMVLLDFIYCFAMPHAPLVIFLDDVQWADLPSLNLVERILTSPRVNEVLIIGAYRSNEVDELHPLKLTINQIAKENIKIEEIFLESLDEKTTVEIVSESFGMNGTKASELGGYVYNKTKGNPFFINRFIQSLYENKDVYTDDKGDWLWDKTKLNELSYTDNVIDLMAKEISSLPEDTKEMMKTVSLLGSTFDLNGVALVTSKSKYDIYKILTPSLKAGYIIHLDSNYRALSLFQEGLNHGMNESTVDINPHFRFLHDRVQQAAYAMIQDDMRAEVHLHTGRVLLANTPPEKISESIFDIVVHYVDATHLVTDPKERTELAGLFLLAGKKAKDSTSYDLAVKYLSLGVSILGKESWSNQYNLTFNLNLELGECENLNGANEKAEKLFVHTLEHANSRFDKLKTYYIQSSLYLKMGNTAKSLSVGREAMRLYNIRFPENPTIITFQANWEIIKYLFMFSTVYRDVDNLNDKKECVDPEIIAINQFLIDIATSAYQENQHLMMIVVLRIIKNYVKYGFTDASVWGFSGLSTVTYSALRLSERGFKLWDLTLKLHERTKSPLIRAKLDYTFNAFYSHWKYPIKEHLVDIIKNVKTCLANGDPNFAGYTIALHFWKKSASGIPLNEVLDTTADQIKHLKSTKNNAGLTFIIPSIQVVKTISGKTPVLGDWSDEDFQDESFLENIKQVGNLTILAYYYNSKILLYYYFEDFEKGLQWGLENTKYQEYLLGQHRVSEWYFYYNLIISSAYDDMSDGDKRKFTAIFKSNLKWFKYWVKGCPQNYEQQYNILLAELETMKGRLGTPIKLYEKAITQAVANGFTQYAAIANERASRLMSKAGLEKQSAHYLKDAMQLYIKWNAFAKCKQLATKYPQIFIYNENDINFRNFAENNFKTESSSNAALDLSTVVKASQSIAGELRLEELLKRLVYIIVENSGAQHGILLLNKNNNLYVAAEGSSGPENTKVYDEFVQLDKINLPLSFINYCWRTLEKVPVSNAQTDSLYQNDPYVVKNMVLSMICLPIISKGNKIGLLYLENNLIEGVFNPSRMEVLNLLVGQISISLENAQLYENLEQKVAERTHELENQKEIAETQKKEAFQQKVYADEERKKSDDLLLNILPIDVANELKTKGVAEAKLYENVSVIFTDFVNFTAISEHMSPNDLVSVLNQCFAAFDNIIEKHGLEKIKTIGDAYLAVSGLPKDQPDHALKTVLAAIDILNWVKDPANNCLFDIRIGINSGPVMAGIVGIKKYVYDIWGDTVNTAARLETASEPGRINISLSTFEKVKNEVDCSFRGKIEAKNKGNIDMYFVENYRLE
ncbi:MAG: AAA family ATPase [Saprospiraceae bacterium]|nr:AAA family ATPase [Saprospiraceae bacterium]